MDSAILEADWVLSETETMRLSIGDEDEEEILIELSG